VPVAPPPKASCVNAWAFFAAAAVEHGPHAVTDLTLWRSIWGHPLVVALHSFLPWGVAMLLVLSTRG